MKKFACRAAPLLALALVVWAILAAASAPAARAPLRFAWVSDTHVGSDRGADDLRATVADINSQSGLSFVLVTGDITEMGSFDNLSLANRSWTGSASPTTSSPEITIRNGRNRGARMSPDSGAAIVSPSRAAASASSVCLL